MVKELLKILKNSKRVGIFTHNNPDGDAIGSAMMLWEFLEINYPKVEKVIFAETKGLSEEFKIILKNVNFNLESFDCDTAISLDCADFVRFEKYKEKFSKAEHTINVDHHYQNSNFAEINYVNILSSNCENLFNLLKLTKLKINKNIAQYCYLGMLTDTNTFSNSNVTKSTFDTASELMSYDIDASAIRNFIFGGYSLGELKILKIAFNKMELFCLNKIIICELNINDFEECKITEDSAKHVINQIFCLKSALVCALITPRENQLHISMRSKPNIDVSVVAKNLGGGGGHICAAAANVNMTSSELKKYIVEALKEDVENYKSETNNIFDK